MLGIINIILRIGIILMFNSYGTAINIKLDETFIKLHFYIIDDNNPIITMYLDVNYMNHFTMPSYIRIKFTSSDLHKYTYEHTKTRKDIADIILERDLLYCNYVQEKIKRIIAEDKIRIEEGVEGDEEGAPK